MNLNYIACGVKHLEILLEIGIKTFTEAFEEQNNPEDFKSYLQTAYSKTIILAQLQNPFSSFYLIYKANDLVGFIKLNTSDAQTDVGLHKSIELERIYILKEYQSMGFGSSALNFSKSLAKKQNKAFLWLGVWEHNLGAIKFYQKHGFYKFGTHPYFIGTDEQTDWLMRFDLSTL